MRYERQAHKHLETLFPLGYFVGQWFKFVDAVAPNTIRYCQTDAVARARDDLFIVIECKYRHTAQAYWQLEHLYLPVVRCALKSLGAEVRGLEVTEWYDPATECPVAPVLVRDPTQPPRADFGVHIWHPRVNKYK